MCVAIYIPANVTVAESILRGVARRNDDGFGLAWTDGSRLHIWRTLNDLDALIERINEYREVPRLVHFRFATHGTVTMDNIHPFWLDERRRAVVVHNGVIQIGTAHDESDTRAFVRHVLGQLKDGWWNNPVTVTQIEKLVSGSRIVLMEEDGRPHFLNKYSGNTSADGVWFSNEQWREFCDPASKGSHHSAVLAETGEAKRYAGYHGQPSLTSSRGGDPFTSATTTAPKAVAAGSGAAPNTQSQSGSGAAPSPTTLPAASTSSPSGTTNSTTKASAILRTTTQGILNDSEVAEWMEAFGRTLVLEYPIATLVMPQGVYGALEAYCASCTPAAWEQGISYVAADITALDLLDVELRDVMCGECKTPLVEVARAEYGGMMTNSDIRSDDAKWSTDDSADEQLPLPAHSEPTAQADGITSTMEDDTSLVSGMPIHPYAD